MEVEFPVPNLDEIELNDVLLNNMNPSLLTVCIDKKFDPSFGIIDNRHKPVFFMKWI